MSLILRARFALTGLGVALGVLGIARDDRRIIWVAIGCLAVALVLRIVARRGAK